MNKIIKALKKYYKRIAKDYNVYLTRGGKRNKSEERYINMFKSALNLIVQQQTKVEQLQELVHEMSNYFPCCNNCEGKTTIGERTDECIYEIDSTNYCTKRGLKNIVGIQKENEQLKVELEHIAIAFITTSNNLGDTREELNKALAKPYSSPKRKHKRSWRK